MPTVLVLSVGRASRLVTRRDAGPVLGYAPGSLKAVMQQQRGRWPAPVASRRHDRALLWDLDQLRAAAAPPAEGEPVVRSRRPDGADADGLVTCLSCGRRFRSLGPHLARVHQLTATEYRTEHRLPATATLIASPMHTDLAVTRQQAQADDPELVARMRAAALPPTELSRRSAEARAGTNDLPAVRHARQAAGRRAIGHAQQARRDQLDARVHAAKYGSMADAITATRDLPSRAAAARLGVGKSTVLRWRHRTGTGTADS